jgi:hypothetical protein
MCRTSPTFPATTHKPLRSCAHCRPLAVATLLQPPGIRYFQLPRRIKKLSPGNSIGSQRHYIGQQRILRIVSILKLRWLQVFQVVQDQLYGNLQPSNKNSGLCIAHRALPEHARRVHIRGRRVHISPANLLYPALACHFDIVCNLSSPVPCTAALTFKMISVASLFCEI